jgi:GNAT superfamily N-acetyltransferase
VKILPLDLPHIDSLQQLIALGEPHVKLRTSSDYWLYAHLFSSTCPVALDGDEIIGAILAFRSQTDPTDIYIQDVVTHPARRRQGVTSALLTHIQRQAVAWGCKRLYLTSEPDNTAAHATWLSFGFTNVEGDLSEHGVSVVSNFKGPGKHRAVYELVSRV